jgi:hypothetical protein
MNGQREDAALAGNSAGPAPLRPPGSMRRTSTIDTTWPEDKIGTMLMQGHARDFYTPADGSPPLVLAEDRLTAYVSETRTILEISSKPDRPELARLVGSRAGGHLRAAIGEVLPQELSAGTPLYLMLDDLAGASLVAMWAWSRWSDNWLEDARRSGITSTAGRNGKMEGICIGFRPGSSALATESSDAAKPVGTPVLSLCHPDDPAGWHGLPEQSGVGMRRARWIDVWVDEFIHVNSGFQDSATSPAGGREAVHEYLVAATADLATGRLVSVTADPRILPYRECPAAAANAGRMIGGTLGDLRSAVLQVLTGVAGCTHLNDALRALAEVPQLAAALAANLHPHQTVDRNFIVRDQA